MGLFDGIGDFIDDIAGGISDIFGGGGLGDLFDFIGGNLGDILDIGAGLWEQMNFEEMKDATSDVAARQAIEILEVAKANAQLAEYDANTAEREGMQAMVAADWEAYNNSRNVDRILSTQTASYAKAGVAPSAGTPLEVAAETAAQGARDTNMIVYNGRTAQARANSAAQKYRMAGEESLRHAHEYVKILKDAADDNITQLEYQQWTAGFGDIMSYGFRQGLWQ